MIVDRQKRKNTILEYMRDGASFSVACQAVGISRRCGYCWREADRGFDTAVLSLLERRMPEDPLAL